MPLTLGDTVRLSLARSASEGRGKLRFPRWRLAFVKTPSLARRASVWSERRQSKWHWASAGTPECGMRFVATCIAFWCAGARQVPYRQNPSDGGELVTLQESDRVGDEDHESTDL